MKAAPIGAFGAMAFTIGKYGLGTLLSLGSLMLGFYATCLIFVFGVLGPGLPVLRLLDLQVHPLHQGRAADRAGHQLVGIGAAADDGQDGAPRRRQVGGRPGDPDRLFVQPRRHLHLPDHGCGVPGPGDQHRPHRCQQQLALLGILLLTSKGAAGVTGSGFIVLAATLSSLGTVPVAGIALILGVDRFMSEARALTNLVGNGVATVVVAKWEGALDEERLHQHLNRETEQEADYPETVLVAEDFDEETRIPGSGPVLARPAE